MRLKPDHPDITESTDWFAPPIDENRREVLRNDPSVLYYRNPDPESGLSYKPTLRLAFPVEPSELIDDDDAEDSHIFCR